MALDIYINQSTDSDPITLTCFGEGGAVFPLAGYSAFAEVRKCLCGDALLDLGPVIEPEDALGIITIPSISHSTAGLLRTGISSWDLILQDPDGKRLPDPILSGKFIVSQTSTQP